MPTGKKPTTSPAMQLLQHVWDNCCKAAPFSYERLNHSMRHALLLAIGSGLTFSPGDFSSLFPKFRAGRWIGVDSGERLYAQAIIDGNQSFILAFEHDNNREPFRADDVNTNTNSPYLHRNAIRRQRERLAVGFTFRYGLLRPTVTNFSADGQTLLACTYKTPRSYPDKIEKRLTLTRDDLKHDRAARKPPKKAKE